ncbi:MAG: V-type ATP synthase subunit F [Clostridia bacterium]|nr:V-type ATP synthase subunit F [Clostridia bacterium]
MKFYLITDDVDTSVGLRLAGVEGKVLSDLSQGQSAFDDALRDDDVGILMVSRRVADAYRDRIEEIRRSRSLPLIVTLPDRAESDGKE